MGVESYIAGTYLQNFPTQPGIIIQNCNFLMARLKRKRPGMKPARDSRTGLAHTRQKSQRMYKGNGSQFKLYVHDTHKISIFNIWKCVGIIMSMIYSVGIFKTYFCPIKIVNSYFVLKVLRPTPS